MGFRLVPKLVTLNDLERGNGHFCVIKTCEAGLVLSVTRILRRIPCMYVCMYVCDKIPPKPLNRFA